MASGLSDADTVGSKILLHPNTTPKVSLSHPEGVYDKLRLGGTPTRPIQDEIKFLLNKKASLITDIANWHERYKDRLIPDTLTHQLMTISPSLMTMPVVRRDLELRLLEQLARVHQLNWHNLIAIMDTF